MEKEEAKVVEEAIADKDFPRALELLDPYMNKEPDDPVALFLFGYIMMESDKAGIAYLIYRRLSQVNPNNLGVWTNFGKAAGEIGRYEEARNYFRRAMKLDPGNQMAIANYAANAMDCGDIDTAIEYGRKALAIKPADDTKQNLGFALLARGNYKEGWEMYSHGMGVVPSRIQRSYTGEPRWDGSKGKTVVIYGEQGLGDQIAFAEPIFDAMKDANIILDVHHKLEGLFGRTFGIETHGTYRSDEVTWNNRPFDAGCSMSELQVMYRDDISKFRGGGFLRTCPIRTEQWRHALPKEKMKIGLAWTGGTTRIQRERRSCDLETFRSFMTHYPDVHWVSLEYKSSDEVKRFNENGDVIVHDYPWATVTEDYDDTAALVANLDLVIAVPTSVVHLAGGIGVPCWCLLDYPPNFMFLEKGNKTPFYSSVELFRKEDGWGVLATIQERLNAELRRSDTSWTGARGTSYGSPGISEDGYLAQGAIQ